MAASIGEKRFWQGGKRVRQVHGSRPEQEGHLGRLIAPPWSGWAWVLFDGQEVPVTVPVYDLVEVE